MQGDFNRVTNLTIDIITNRSMLSSAKIVLIIIVNKIMTKYLYTLINIPNHAYNQARIHFFSLKLEAPVSNIHN